MRLNQQIKVKARGKVTPPAGRYRAYGFCLDGGVIIWTVKLEQRDPILSPDEAQFASEELAVAEADRLNALIPPVA